MNYMKVSLRFELKSGLSILKTKNNIRNPICIPIEFYNQVWAVLEYYLDYLEHFGIELKKIIYEEDDYLIETMVPRDLGFERDLSTCQFNEELVEVEK